MSKTENKTLSENKDDTTLITKAELNVTLNDFGKSLITTMSDLFKKEIEVHSETLGKGKAIASQELGEDHRGVQPVAKNDLIPQAKLETFMNNILTIYVHPSSDKEAHNVLVPGVNGINQPIIRGVECKVKRKYVEALARTRHTRYDQKFPDITKPHKYIMAPDLSVSNPFTVRHDPHKLGPQWLQGILAEA